MAFMSQDRKKVIASKLKTALAGSGLKYSLRVRNHSTIVMTIQAGPIDFRRDLLEQDVADRFPGETYSMSVNPYWYHDHFTGKSLDLLTIIFQILNDGNHDRSDIMTDYFDVGWYVDVHIGTWDKPYQITP